MDQEQPIVLTGNHLAFFAAHSVFIGTMVEGNPTPGTLTLNPTDFPGAHVGFWKGLRCILESDISTPAAQAALLNNLKSFERVVHRVNNIWYQENNNKSWDQILNEFLEEQQFRDDLRTFSIFLNQDCVKDIKKENLKDSILYPGFFGGKRRRSTKTRKTKKY